MAFLVTLTSEIRNNWHDIAENDKYSSHSEPSSKLYFSSCVALQCFDKYTVGPD